MRRFLKTLPLTLALVLALTGLGLVLTSCNSSQTQVRFVDAVAESPEMDIEFNGAKIFTEITFPSYQPSSGYRSVPSGSDTIEGVLSGGTTEVFSTSNVNLSSGTEFTAVATGSTANTNGVIFLTPADDNTAPADGQVSFRIIDAAISSPSSVAVYILANQSNGEPPTITGTTPITATVTAPSAPTTATSAYETQSFNSLNTGFTGEVCTAGSTIPIFTFPIANFGSATEGAIRTIVLTDNSGATGFDTSPQILSDVN
jgi:Domain of unknown function (DUF4397)